MIEPALETYLDSLLPARNPVLVEMEERAGKEDFPIVGPKVGRLLFILTRLARARRVLELGSGFGYSACWFAQALSAGGEVHLTDASAQNLDQARDYLRRAGLADKARFHQGNALELIDQMSEPFDVVFSDVDKEDYPQTIDKVARVLGAGGLFVTDNALWYGKVVQTPPPDAATAGVVEFNRRLANDQRFDTAIVPLRDGLAIALKR